uniref:Uncharacterized protein n=1 Tax=Glossina brevipalpis TaxID=37001 RepID=A0A1A9X4V0_9MUSC
MKADMLSYWDLMYALLNSPIFLLHLLLCVRVQQAARFFLMYAVTSICSAIFTHVSIKSCKNWAVNNRVSLASSSFFLSSTSSIADIDTGTSTCISKNVAKAASSSSGFLSPSAISSSNFPSKYSSTASKSKLNSTDSISSTLSSSSLPSSSSSSPCNSISCS